MKKEYDHKKIEKKWQKEWAKKKIYQTKNPPSHKATAGQGKFYILDMFPYVSGEGIHVGHPKGYIATDVVSRKKRMQGFNVLHPMGFDSFGLPTENYAIKTKTNPVVSVAKNIARFKKQLEIIGFDYDWSREVNTSDPKFYKWTQWIFLKLLERGFAYESNEPVNWCPRDMTILANEDVEDGKCERCGAVVEKKPIRQWVLKITDYADRLLADLDALDWPESIKESQRNWIGRSEGIMYKQKVKDLGIKIEAYDSIPQTFMAQTFCVIAPEHPLVKKLIKRTKYEEPVLDFVEKFKQRKIKKGFETEKEIEGIFTGRYVDNPFGTGDLPVWIATFVIADYGTGIVNSSVHDERDFAFAKKYNIPLREVVEPLVVRSEGLDKARESEPFIERNAVVCIIKHWSENKFLCHSVKNTDWRGFVVGGVEDGEDPVETGIREITEETGYKNIKFVKQLGGVVHSKFWQDIKKQNRFAHFTPLYFKLQNNEQGEIEQKQKDFYDMHWVSEKEVLDFVSREDMKVIWKRYLGINQPIIKNGILTEPVEFKGREWGEVREDIIDYIVKKGFGYRKVTYKLHDWVFSRQRYWGEPIPVLRDGTKVIPVKEKDLPVKLPKVKSYKPTGTAESPLANVPNWINVKVGQKVLRRESNTMPQWAGSSWYYLRYMDPDNNKALVDKNIEKYWNEVDLYVGGAEHATRHLIYARFWHKFLYDIGVVVNKEPFKKLQHVGLIIASDGRKMSKRFGNIINPDSIVSTYGADTLRLYEMFMGPFDQSVSWSTDSLMGPRRFIERVWKIGHKIASPEKISSRFTLPGVPGGTYATQKSSPASLAKLLHKTIKKVSEDIDSMRFNTAVSSLMILLNEMEKSGVSLEDLKKFLQILSPFAPHITEELWSMLGEKKSVHLSSWPEYDKEKIKDDEVKIVVQINGKVRAEIMVQADENEESVKKKSLANEVIARHTAGKEIKKFIYIKNRLINIVM
ncbi:leucine--tRNA ligase [Candidatus Nomurabacteria bacterium RIFCSPLOWO2_01_FULL_39_18]|uniref:Leucine--tRNA ligase n=1 Tax=Candidatus Nomurabacteria bacterium RIFCSPHIGHO2_01_FULL_40_24b TaxID=1801739 RepID=A0A1F6V6C4_9BACT|nr:MAG: leucine--tRNA ligase [Candidatus Nomurabacteria bacterium RIFCSPHIGHO2_01_FULL_40_24b]OGI89273.1 MAG: leucine--tRNA ligase [Candidatus Nomurabacteria bacterium RIFCSPLOWO2_01_FULL_39_18]